MWGELAAAEHPPHPVLARTQDERRLVGADGQPRLLDHPPTDRNHENPRSGAGALRRSSNRLKVSSRQPFDGSAPWGVADELERLDRRLMVVFPVGLTLTLGASALGVTALVEVQVRLILLGAFALGAALVSLAGLAWPVADIGAVPTRRRVDWQRQLVRWAIGLLTIGLASGVWAFAVLLDPDTGEGRNADRSAKTAERGKAERGER
jgi:hypothetical protein